MTEKESKKKQEQEIQGFLNYKFKGKITCYLGSRKQRKQGKVDS